MERKFLSKIERAFVEELRANTRDKGAYMKLSVLILLDMDETYDRIAAILGLGVGTVSNCKKKYEHDGLDKYLDTHYVPYNGKLNDDQLGQLEEEVCKGLYTRTQEVQAFIEKQFGVCYSLSAVTAILKKLGFVYKKTMSIPGKADVAVQEAFLAQLEPFLAEIEANEAIYFVDAVHPQHNTRSDYAWIKQGEEKAVPTNTGRDRVNINGAINAHKPEEVIIVEAERINAQATIDLYDQILKHNPDKSIIYILCDNAKYYYNVELNTYLVKNPKIVQLFLPPYSPNLNLIERLWKFLRKKVINTTFYPTFQEFRLAILKFFANLANYKDELQSIMRHNFQRLPAIPAA
jgi:transposase